MGTFQRFIGGFVVLASLGLTASSQAAFQTFTISDGNGSANIEAPTTGTADSGSRGMYSWDVDGTSQLFQQWFWFRQGSTGGEQSLGSLTLAGAILSNTNFDPDNDSLLMRFESGAGGSNFAIEVSYQITGGAGVGDIRETIKIIAGSNGLSDFHFFQYSDFDLNGTPGDDVVVFTNANTVTQTDVGGGLLLSETVATPSATRREAAFFNTTYTNLEDGSPTDLSNTPAIGVPLGPGDVTWAFQWDLSLGANAEFLISKDKRLGPNVPEPASIAIWTLLATAVGVAVRVQRVGIKK